MGLYMPYIMLCNNVFRFCFICLATPPSVGFTLAFWNLFHVYLLISNLELKLTKIPVPKLFSFNTGFFSLIRSSLSANNFHGIKRGLHLM